MYQTRSNKRKRVDEKPLEELGESPYNIYAGQQVCSIRSLDMEEYHMQHFEDPVVHQMLFDAGAALMDFIVVRGEDGEFQMNTNFGDYDAWEQAKNCVLKNCKYLRKLGHPLFQ